MYLNVRELRESGPRLEGDSVTRVLNSKGWRLNCFRLYDNLVCEMVLVNPVSLTLQGNLSTRPRVKRSACKRAYNEVVYIIYVLLYNPEQHSVI